MEMSRRFKIWLQRNINLSTRDPSTQSFNIDLTPDQYSGIYKGLRATDQNILSTIEIDSGQQSPINLLRLPPLHWGGFSSTRSYTLPRNAVVQNIGPLYNTAVNINEDARRHQLETWVLLRNPFPEREDYRGLEGFFTPGYFIIPFKTPQELQGIFSVYQWLGFNPKDYVIRIEDNTGRQYRAD